MYNNTEKEVWKDVKCYEGIYKISSLGRFYSVYKAKNNFKEPYLKWKTNNRGYKTICLTKDGKNKYFLVHRLVAMHFIENPNEYPQVNHKDENKENNSVENLEWCTNHYNALYGTRVERTTNNNLYKKSREKMKKKAIGKPLKSNGEIIVLNSLSEAENYGFCHDGVSKCCRGKTKYHKGYVWEYAN